MALPSASGGFVYRSERSPTRGQPPTPAVVGPGSYELARQGETNPAPVPFHTSTVRSLAGGATTTSAVTPGPGAYDGVAKVGNIGTSSARVPVSSFASGVPRLAAEKSSRIEAPGPGAYDAGNAWVKGGSRYQPAGRGAPHSSLLVVSRTPTAPSVPGRGQSYGYEEAVDGSLVLQPPPDKAHTGVGRDTVGPGSYELAGKQPGAGKGGARWAASKTARGQKYGSVAPGPGTYNLAEAGPRKPGAGLAVSIGGVEVVFGGTQGTSSFVSRAPRPLAKAAASTPGPGDYLGPGVAAVGPGASNAALRASAAAFGCTAHRGSWEVDPVQARQAPTFYKSPGPGAYDDPRTRPGGAASSHTAGSLMAAAAASAPFTTTSLRFGLGQNAAHPGPGEYQTDVVTSLEYEAYKKVSGSRPAGGFGGSAGRFPHQRGASSPSRMGVPTGVLPDGGELGVGPGPGAYETTKEPQSARGVARSGTSNFASSTGRFRPITAPPAVPDLAEYDGTSPPRGDPRMLGPGSYNPDPAGGRPSYKHALGKAVPFGTEARRTKLELPSKENPGPGRYNTPAAADALAAKPVSVPPPKSGFASGTGRFAGASPGKYTPGPGAYIAPDSTVVRKSYNVTYA